MNECKCGDARVIHAGGIKCAMCSCEHFVPRDVVTMTTPPKPRWLQRLTARDESGYIREGGTL